MPKFGRKSKERLATCHPDLQRLFNEVIKHFDCSVICGHRTKEEQDTVYNARKSKVKYPKSKHNSSPSMAIDVAPYIEGRGVVWDEKQCYYFSGYVKGVADNIGIQIRLGSDWDGDDDISDQTFLDLVHFELR